MLQDGKKKKKKKSCLLNLITWKAPTRNILTVG